MCDLPLCRVLLMDDAQYPCWLVLVPRANRLREVIDLPPDQQQQLWREVALASQAVQVLWGGGGPLWLLRGVTAPGCGQRHRWSLTGSGTRLLI